MAFNRVQQIKFRQLDGNGYPAESWKVHTYLGGTTDTREVTYSDNAGIENSNPVILDDNGEANIYLDDGVVYKFVIETDQGEIYDVQDNITSDGGVTSGGGGYPPAGATGDLQFKAGATTFGGDSNLNWSVIDQILTLNGFLNADYDITARKFIGDGSELTGLDFVPYEGADRDVNLGANSIKALQALSTNAFSSTLPYFALFESGTYSSLFLNSNESLMHDLTLTSTNTNTYLRTRFGTSYADVNSSNGSSHLEVSDGTNTSTYRSDGASVDGNISAKEFTANDGVYNSVNDQTQKRNGVTKLTHGDTQTTITQDLDVQGDITGDSVTTDGDSVIGGRDLTIEATGTLTGTSTTETIEMEAFSTYIVSASMFGSNCEIVLSAIASNLSNNVISGVSVLNSASFNLGSLNIQTMNGLSVGSFSSENSCRVQLIFNAVGVSGTTTWKWSAKRLH